MTNSGADPGKPTAALDGPPTVAIQGEPGSFSDAAARRLLGEMRLVSFVEFEAAAECVAAGGARYAVLPVTNSTVGRVLDIAALSARHGLEVVTELVLPVRQALIVTRAGVGIEELREVRSHPVALAQCSDFLESHAWIAPRPVADTAGAVREVCATGRRELAAIGPARAAALHGGHVLLESVANSPDNRTRFALVQRVRLAAPLTREGRQPAHAGHAETQPNRSDRHEAGTVTRGAER